MKKLSLFGFSLLVFALLATPAYLGYGEQEVIEEWVARYNDPTNHMDIAYDIAVDSSGNVYVTGHAQSSDFGTIKYNNAGELQWISPKRPELGPSYAIAVDSSGNAYATGWGIEISAQAQDYATVKLSSSGEEQWVAWYNGDGNWNDNARDIAVDEFGNVYVTGNSWGDGTGYDYVTVKYDSAGIEQWAKRYNGPINRDDFARAIGIDSSGNIYVTGFSYGNRGYFDYTTIKYNSSGDEQWVVRYTEPEPPYGDNRAADMYVDSSGTIYVTGYSDGWGTQKDCATVKYNASGELEWEARYNGSHNYVDLAQAIAVDSSGNVYITGNTWGTTNNLDYLTIKYDSLGFEVWTAEYNGSGDGVDVAVDIVVDSSGNVCVTGESWGDGTEYDYATVCYDSWGTQKWAARYNGPGNDRDVPCAMAIDHNSNVFVTGRSIGETPYGDYATIKYRQKRTPEEQIQILIDEVYRLVDEGKIHPPRSGGIITKLNEALERLNAGKERPACRKLHDFIDQVNAAINVDPLTEEEGQALIDAANAIIAELCG